MFESIVKEESREAESKNFDFPSFGTSATEYEKVKEFYSFFTNFTTTLRFQWKDQYNLNAVRKSKNVTHKMEIFIKS